MNRETLVAFKENVFSSGKSSFLGLLLASVAAITMIALYEYAKTIEPVGTIVESYGEFLSLILISICTKIVVHFGAKKDKGKAGE